VTAEADVTTKGPKVMFYHLTRSPVEDVVRMLAEKGRGQGWRVAIRAKTRDRLDWLDEKLWLGPEDGFLPHGVDGGPHDGHQPVLLTDGAPTNGAKLLITIDGADPIPPEEATDSHAMICVVFDGQDGSAVETARGQWRQITGAGHTAEYWSQDSGKWQKKA